MSELVTPAKAIEWLEEQLEILGKLRNASTRDSSFRQWRQAMLTVVERIWPGDEERTRRVRAVSFSPPVANASDRATREHYDRGCAETRRFLRLWVAEIRKVGLQPVDASDEAHVYEPPELSEPLELSDEFMDLDADIFDDDEDLDLTAEFPGEAIPEAPRPRVVDLPRAAPPPPPAPPRRPVAENRPPAPQPGATRRRTERPMRPKARLKDMLGLGEAPPPEPRPVAPPPAREKARRPMPPGASPIPRTSSPPSRAAVAPPSGPPRISIVQGTQKPRTAEPAPVARAPMAPPRPVAPPPAPPPPPSDAELGPDDLENSIFEALERARTEVVPVRPSPRTAPPGKVARRGQPDVAASQQATARAMEGELDSVRVLAVIALAAEIDQLGVPESDRALVQLLLSNLARQLEAGELRWSTLQEAVAIVMIHPRLARRALPVFLQFLEAAA